MTLKPWIVCLALAVTAGNASAQSGVGARRGGNLFQPPAKSADPYAKLFTNVQAELKPREALARATASAGGRNNCGMTAGIARQLRPDATGSVTRIVPPPTCK
jgi:hypothetical protein